MFCATLILRRDLAMRFSPETVQVNIISGFGLHDAICGRLGGPRNRFLPDGRQRLAFDISAFPPNDQVILTALKQYGLIVADNGGAMFISGGPDKRWNNNELDQLKTLTASDFEVVLMGPVYTPDNVPTGPSPVASSFTANPPTITRGESSTLSWSATNAIYTIHLARSRTSAWNECSGDTHGYHHLQALRD